jgi:hypothetical protein
MIFRGIHPNSFLDTHAEWHAFVQGACEVICPWPPRWTTASENLVQDIHDEHHYYMFGRTLGLLALVTIILLVTYIISGMAQPTSRPGEPATTTPAPQHGTPAAVLTK